MVVGSTLRIASGLLAWSVAEYGTHRWLMHASRGSSSLADEHLDHNADPDHTVELRVDVHNVCFKGGALAIGSIVVSPGFGLGFTFGYAGYTYLHDRIHHRAPKSRLAQRVWLHHYRHHFGRPRRNWAVTNPLLDVVFATDDSETTPVRVPSSRAPAWLSDGEARFDKFEVG